MKTVILTTALAGTVLADQPARILRRQELVELPNPEQTSLPKACRDAAAAVISAMPPEPTQVSVFSSAYYETATRTATGDERECAWVTEIPEALYPKILEHSLELTEWAREGDNGELLQDIDDECGGTEAGYGLNASDTCQDEWDVLGEMMMEAAGTAGFPEEDEDDDDDDNDTDDNEDDDEAGSPGVAIPAFGATAALAAFIGSVALF